VNAQSGDHQSTLRTPSASRGSYSFHRKLIHSRSNLSQNCIYWSSTRHDRSRDFHDYLGSWVLLRHDSLNSGESNTKAYIALMDRVRNHISSPILRLEHTISCQSYAPRTRESTVALEALGPHFANKLPFTNVEHPFGLKNLPIESEPSTRLSQRWSCRLSRANQ
jgi:hypothetical protein